MDPFTFQKTQEQKKAWEHTLENVLLWNHKVKECLEYLRNQKNGIYLNRLTE